MPQRHKVGNRIRWQARVRVRGERKSFGLFDSYAEAAEAEAIVREMASDITPQTVAAWCTRFLATRKAEGLHRGTDRYQLLVDRISADPIGKRPLRGLTDTDVRVFVRRLIRTPVRPGRGYQAAPGRTLSASQVRQTLVFLRQALERALELDMVRNNVARGVRVPRMARTSVEWAYLKADEVKTLLASSGLTEQQHAIFGAAVYTGLRAGELWGLRWCDVTLVEPRPELVVRYSYRQPTKSGRPRRVALIAQAVTVLTRWRGVATGEGEALVFPAHSGECHSRGYDAGLKKALERAGLPLLRFHDLRHTHASHLIMGTWTAEPWPLEMVQVQLGHSSRTTTERYAHLAPDAIHRFAYSR